jgi:hypothetical protein
MMAKSVSIRDLAIGFAVGAAAASLLPVLFPGEERDKRELLKRGLKQSMRALEGGAEKLAEIRENVEDILAEVSAEMAREAEEDHAGEDAGDRSRAS